ncbi:DivIVA domain-containing protein [Micromonospora soli]|uniref:DivIVA domain-containing protein n=1 Tax=Micromonospora sp. NBRC 110009 TaxID=3061627 RepID=UPI002671F1F6|nr:DivIVA domain-containing protein [Micromonospora sp. NBRC 110009]WKU01542.1 DivIVA domain-containing protein [Micromonospora sp. NBRC 110009]
MRNVLDLFRSRPSAASRPPNGGWYRSESCRPLSPGQVRERHFRTVRRGLDPEEVHAFLYRVAGDLALARRELARTAEENVRIKRALRSWQSRFTPGAGW